MKISELKILLKKMVEKYCQLKSLLYICVIKENEKRKIMKNLELKNKVQAKLEAFGYSADTVAEMLSSKLFNQALNAGYKTPKQISLYICNFH